MRLTTSADTPVITQLIVAARAAQTRRLERGENTVAAKKIAFPRAVSQPANAARPLPRITERVPILNVCVHICERRKTREAVGIFPPTV